MPKIKPSSAPPSGQIQNRTVIPEGLLAFSFKYLDLSNNPKFVLSNCKDGYLDKLLGRLKDLCSLKVKEFRASHSTSLRAHRIAWGETSEPDGFTSLGPQLREEEAWQFEITANSHGRVHGFLVDDVFYVVWVDPKHQLYPRP